MVVVVVVLDNHQLNRVPFLQLVVYAHVSVPVLHPMNLNVNLVHVTADLNHASALAIHPIVRLDLIDTVDTVLSLMVVLILVVLIIVAGLIHALIPMFVETVVIRHHRLHRHHPHRRHLIIGQRHK